MARNLFDSDEFIEPADGGLVRLLGQLLVAAENLGWKSVGQNYWKDIELNDSLKDLISFLAFLQYPCCFSL